MNRDDRVLAIVHAAKHLLDLAGLHFHIERLERPGELFVDRFTGLGPLDQNREVVALAAKRLHQFAVLLQPAAALQHFLGFGLVFPEIGRGGARLEAGQLFFGTGRFKDSSANRWPVW